MRATSKGKTLVLDTKNCEFDPHSPHKLSHSVKVTFSILDREIAGAAPAETTKSSLKIYAVAKLD